MDAAARLRVSYILVYITRGPGIRPHQVVHAPHGDQIHTVLFLILFLLAATQVEGSRLGHFNT